MQNTIHQLLEELGNTFADQIQLANDNAKAAHAELAQIKTGLRLLAGSPALVSESATPNDCEAEQAIQHRLTPRRNATVQDDALVAVLNESWATAAQIRAKLMAIGEPISEGTTYNRMRKLTAKLPDLVETTVKPERWRLKGKRVKSERPKRKCPPHQGLPAVLSAQHGVPGAMANDNGELHRPSLHHGDCLHVMSSMPDQSVDLILADLPYGVTKLQFDTLIDMDRLWAEYRRIIKPRGNIVLFGSQPFTTALVNAAPDLFKYTLVWEKTTGTNFFHCHDKPIKTHEDILIFSPGTNLRKKRSTRRATFNPVGATKKLKTLKGGIILNYLKAKTPREERRYEGLTNCPRTVVKYAKDRAPRGESHPFAKPLALLDYLIKMYSNEGDVVLDNTMGSGSTCLAAMRNGRRSVGIEQNERWFNIARDRVNGVMGEHVHSEKVASATDRLAKCEPLAETGSSKRHCAEHPDVEREEISGEGLRDAA